jgi:hypothetical protein
MNGANGQAVEVAPNGMQVAWVTLVPNGAGDLFGLTVAPDHDLVFVNDGTNAVDRAAPTSGGPTP